MQTNGLGDLSCDAARCTPTCSEPFGKLQRFVKLNYCHRGTDLITSVNTLGVASVHYYTSQRIQGFSIPLKLILGNVG